MNIYLTCKGVHYDLYEGCLYRETQRKRIPYNQRGGWLSWHHESNVSFFARNHLNNLNQNGRCRVKKCKQFARVLATVYIALPMPLIPIWNALVNGIQQEYS